MTENLQNDNRSMPNFAQPEPSAPVPQPLPAQQPIMGSVSRSFKIAFVIVGMPVFVWFSWLILTGDLTGWGGLGFLTYMVFVWGSSVAGLLFAAFLRNILPNKLVSVIFGAAMGVQVALVLALVGWGVHEADVVPRMFGTLLFIAVYVLINVSIWLFVRYMVRRDTPNTVGVATKTGNFGVISLLLGLFLSLSTSGILYPYIHIDLFGQKSSEFGFPFYAAPWGGDVTGLLFVLTVIIPNWLVWSIAVYLLLGMWYRFTSRHS